MGRIFSTILALLIVFAVMGSVHAYVWLRLVRDTELPTWLSTLMTGFLMLMAVSIPASMVLWRLLTHFGLQRLPQFFMVGAFWWIGLLFYLLIFLFSFDSIVFGMQALHRFLAVDFDLGKRVFMARTVGSLALFSTFGVSALAMRQVMVGPVVESIRIRLKRWPESLNGFRLVQISDLHIGPTVDAAYVQNVVDQLIALKPDLIAITGDLVDGSVEHLWPKAKLLEQLKAKYGVYFVTGNHEYYSGADAWINALTKIGIRVLRNERVAIAEAFDLAGVDDMTAHAHAKNHGADLHKALYGRDTNRPVILLAHQPKQVHQAAKYKVDLQLSGHTHAGQLWPFNYVVRFVQPHVQGLAQHSETTQIYVNRGTGYWGPPMRLPDRSEISLLEIEAT